ncbi:MAG: hypothetical protein ACFB02_08355 [Mastigocoleus sp.]
MTPSMTDSAVKAAIQMISDASTQMEEKIGMLIEIAQGFCKKPKTENDLWNAIALFNQADKLSEQDYPLLKARATVGKASALKAIPQAGVEYLLQSRTAYQKAIPVLEELASSVETAEAQMNLGLVLQSLASYNLAPIVDSIQIYQQALQIFTYSQYPQEYAILHNNIAIAYLSMSTGSQEQYLYEGLAIQSFETALKYINLIEHPTEYAMLQNNLGNALQYVPSSHPFENNLKAVQAYEEALKVRTLRDTPLEYANTIANQANALSNLPDDLEKPENGNSQKILQAIAYYQQSLDIFTQYNQQEQAEIIIQAMQEIRSQNSE